MAQQHKSFSRATPTERMTAIQKRWQDLKTQREPWLRFYREISEYIAPFSGRFETSNHGEDRSYDLILDDHGGYALNILVSGLASGGTSPLRPWFRLTPPTDELQQDEDTIEYLGKLQNLIGRLFHKTNTYNSLHQLYRELCLFGTAVDLIYDDPKQVMTHHVLTAGEYCIACDANNQVDTVYREFELTVSQAVKMFGYQKVSKTIQSLFDAGKLDEYFTFIHAIEPRVDRDYNSRENLDMPWASYYIELNSGAKEPVQESGFEYFPALCPRWDVLGADPYGVSPAFNVLPDVKELQQVTLRKQELLDMYTHPPIEAAAASRNNPIDISPGAINYVPPNGQSGNIIRPIVQSYGDLNAINDTVQTLHTSIENKFYVNMFLMLNTAAGDRKTTVEVAGLQEEQRLVLGPVTERLSKEVQSPLIQMAIWKIMRSGSIEPPPNDLRAVGMDIEIQSVFAQAQRAVDINAYDRYLSTLQTVASVNPEVLDRLDVDGLVDEYTDRLGISYKMIRSREDADEIRQQRAQQQQQQQEAAQNNLDAQSMNYMAQAQRSGAEAARATQEMGDVAGGLMGF